MYHPLRSRAPRLAAAAALALALGSTLPAAGQGFDPTKTPVTPVPADRWGQLAPAAILNDLSGWNFGSTPWTTHTFIHDVDVENGWVFATTGKGLKIWDGRTDPANPTTEAYKFVGQPGGIPVWHQNDTKFYLFGVDAPAGVDSVLGMACISNNGFLIWNTTDKSNPKVIYQDDDKDGTQVWATTYGGIHYAFYAATNNKVLVYDLSAAMSSTASPWCLDRSPSSTLCNGGGRSVYAGKINTTTSVNYLHGAGDYLAVSQGFSGVEIWRVSNPRSPERVASFGGVGGIYGVALWQEGAAYYLAAIDIVGQVLRIFDLSCLAGGSCTGTPPQVGSFPLTTGNATDYLFLSFSRHGTKPFLYVGGENQFHSRPQGEYLLDVSSPGNPVDVTPQVDPSGYWGWYYAGNPTGFNWVMPRRGKFNGDAFYRAAFSLMDVHSFVGELPPAAGFGWSPSEVYPGTPVTFTDQSTGNVTSWTWTFQDGTPSSSFVETPPAVTFATAGSKTITQLVGNGNQAEDSQLNKTLTVLAPEPQIGTVTVSPASPQQCQSITFGATGVTGQPPLTYAWQVLDSGSAVVASGNGTTFTWDTSQLPRPPAGSYTASLTVNGTGSANKTQAFTLAAEIALPPDNSFAPTADAYTASTVQFHLNVPGGTGWKWDFDGDGFANDPWLTDPVTGPHPQHTYSTIGQRDVKVMVRNCSSEVTSSALTVNITSIINLQAQFSVFCLGGCFFDTGQAIPFSDQSTGPPETWQYDWEGNGSWDTAELTAPVSSHVYAAAGQYRPKLRVRSGAATDEFQLAETLIVSGAAPPPPPQPSIAISGLTNGAINASLPYTASASNCTPSTFGWSWQTSGGTITGEQNTATVNISWSTAGTKTVQASNANCGSATGTRTVTITDGSNPPPPPPPPPGTLGASFTISPASPKVGQTVTFNGTGSTGTPDSWFWTLGDGTLKTGSSITHVYGAAGTYQVQLSVTKASSSCPPAPYCESATTKSLTVSSNDPPPPPPLPALVARFTSPSCTNDGSGERCRAQVGDTVSFTSAVEGSPTSLGWFFGDGDSSAQVNPTHKFLADGTFRVTLKLGRAADGAQAQAFKDFEIVPRPIGKAAVQPFIAQRSSAPDIPDMVVYSKDAGTQPLTVTIHRPGETQPLVAPLQIPALAAGETRLLPALLGQLQTNGSGTIVVEAGGSDPQPLVAVYQTAGPGASYGDWIGGTVVPAETSQSQIDTPSHVIGLNDDAARTTDFGIGNASPRRARFNLRFFDNVGQLLDERNEQELPAFGHLLLDSETLRQRGINGEDDYRVEIETLQGGPLMPFGTSRSLDSNDVSYLPTMKAGAGRQYLMAVAAGIGSNKAKKARAKGPKIEWATDVLLVNPADDDVSVTIRFVGLTVKRARNRPAAITEVVHAGDSVRLVDVLRERLGVLQGNGMLVIESAGADGVFPLVLGETYNVRVRRFGQTAGALNDGQLIHTGQTRLLLGLREDGLYRSALSFYNPGGATAKAELVYRSAAGAVLSRIKLNVGAGKLVQRGARDGGALKKSFSGLFSIEVNVTDGDLLVGGQAIRKSTGDTSFVPVQPLP